jgi:hypothetical protein
MAEYWLEVFMEQRLVVVAAIHSQSGCCFKPIEFCFPSPGRGYRYALSVSKPTKTLESLSPCTCHVMKLILAKLLRKIIILVLCSAADLVCSKLLNTRNFLSSESIIRLSLVLIADIRTAGNYTKFACSINRGSFYPTTGVEPGIQGGSCWIGVASASIFVASLVLAYFYNRSTMPMKRSKA